MRPAGPLGFLALLALTFAALATGCVSVAGTYPCETSTQCVQGGVPGSCEPVGFCSFPDPSCPSGQRYAVHAAPALAARCTGDELLSDAPPETADGGVDASAGPCDFDDDVDEGEQCDDADHDDDDGCVDCRWATCGDGHVRADVEECDPPGPGCTTGCLACAPPHVLGLEGTCWEVLATGTYSSGANRCAALAGGHVASATSGEEIDGPLAAAFAGSGAPELYLGLTDALVEGDWLFTTGEAAPLLPWAVGQPNGAIDEQCGGLASGGWRDFGCGASRPALCEREPALVRALDGHAYRRVFAGKAHAIATRDGCAHGGRLAVLESPEELELLRAQVPPRANALWLGGTYADATITWASAGGATGLAWAAGEPSLATGCVGIKSGGLAVRPCTDGRELLCELED